MNGFFLDMAYLQALVNSLDQWHGGAMAWRAAARGPFWTTDYVLLELANSLSRGKTRRVADVTIGKLRSSSGTSVLEQSRMLFDRGLGLYRTRDDKDWSLTDCSSFVVMSDLGLRDALTSDHHFDQAGFRALLLHDPDDIITP